MGTEGDHPSCTSLGAIDPHQRSSGAEGWGYRSHEAKPLPSLRQGRRPSGGGMDSVAQSVRGVAGYPRRRGCAGDCARARARGKAFPLHFRPSDDNLAQRVVYFTVCIARLVQGHIHVNLMLLVNSQTSLQSYYSAKCIYWRDGPKWAHLMAARVAGTCLLWLICYA